jgi:hypothetical protein
MNMGNSGAADIPGPSTDILSRLLSFSVLFSETFHNRFLIPAKLVSRQRASQAGRGKFTPESFLKKGEETKKGKGKYVD